MDQLSFTTKIKNADLIKPNAGKAPKKGTKKTTTTTNKAKNKKIVSSNIGMGDDQLDNLVQEKTVAVVNKDVLKQ